MTPDAAVARLAEIIAARAVFTEDELYAAMAEAGVPQRDADRAYKFTQIAWGRILLDGLGLQFSPDYLCFNSTGDVIESGLLSDQPYFKAAMARTRTPSPGLPQFALMSSEVNAVNSALLAGSKPENLVMAPTALFMEPATPVGLDRARHLLSARVNSSANLSRSAEAKKKSPPKPWWRFW